MSVKKIEEAAWPSLASILVLFPVVECNADVDLWKTTALKKKKKHQQQKKKTLIIQHSASQCLTVSFLNTIMNLQKLGKISQIVVYACKKVEI